MGIDHDIPITMGIAISPVNNASATSFSTSTIVPVPSSFLANGSPSVQQPTTTGNGIYSKQMDLSNLFLHSPSNESLSSEAIQTLREQGYSTGLIDAMLKAKRAFALRIWIVDNSGSMLTHDGNRIVEDKSRTTKMKFVSCSRWAEMQQTVQYHAQLAATLRQPTIFRLLNNPGREVGPQQFSIATKGIDYIDQELETASSIMRNASPGGVTPLSEHITEIRSAILELAPTLQQQGTKVAIVIATDGLPTTANGSCNVDTKREFRNALQSLQGLPVWIVIRLSTDDDEVVEYYNELDNQLELSLEVLDDFVAEAKEINAENKWLNYALPMHRMREMGLHNRLFDLLDERKLSKGELRGFLRIVLGDDAMATVPDPEADWKGFCKRAVSLVDSTDQQWNPITKRFEPWVNMKKVKQQYNKRGILRCLL